MRTFYVILLILLSLNLRGQEVKGRVTYTLTKIKSNASNDITAIQAQTNMRAKQLASREAQLSKGRRQNDEYEVIFNGDQSSFKSVEALGKLKNENLYFKDLSKGIFEQVALILRKPFIIRDSLPQMRWRVTDLVYKFETYTCKKAILLNADGTETKTTAWFTEQIPVSTGPAEFHGLPGLILIVNDGKRIFKYKSINLDAKKKQKVIRPKKGKKVTQKEFNQLRISKLKESFDKQRKG